MTRVYLAGRYQRQSELRDKAAELRSLGVECDPAWLREPHDWDGESPEQAEILALDDWNDIVNCHLLMAFTDGPGTTRRGGRHVELGIAIGRHTPILVVGPPENVFHFMPGVDRVADWEAAIEWLGSWMHRGGGR